MPYRYVRVTAEDDNTPNCPIVLDVLLDDAGHPKAGPPYCGWWGNFKSTSVWPFIAKQIDDCYMLDFGSDEETDQDDRYVIFNLLHGAIHKGKKFKMKYEKVWYSFTVRELAAMADGKVLD